MIALPTTPAATDNAQKKTQRKQMKALRKDYDSLLEKLREDEMADDAALSPLAMLLNELRKQAQCFWGYSPKTPF